MALARSVYARRLDLRSSERTMAVVARLTVTFFDEDLPTVAAAAEAAGLTVAQYVARAAVSASGEARRDVLRILAGCPGGLAEMSLRLAVTLCTNLAR